MVSQSGKTSSAEEDIAGDSVSSIVGAHGQQGRVSRLQRVVDQASDLVGRPGFVVIFVAIAAGWLGYNILAPRLGWFAFDKPPFVGLELTVTLTALFLAAIIVATQRREDRLADRRAQLTLHLAVLAERKNAKIIALLEEIRRDSPALTNRRDAESEAMSAPTDPKALLERIDEESDKPIPS